MAKFNLQIVTAAILAIGGLVMLFCGVYIEPQGQIHESLLIGFGEVATFAGALFGIDAAYSKKLWDFTNSYAKNKGRQHYSPPTPKTPSGEKSLTQNITPLPPPSKTQT